MLEESIELYDFMNEIQDSILEEYKTINKSLRGNKLWQKVVNQEKVVVNQEELEEQEQVKETHNITQWKVLEHRSNKIKF